MIGIKPVLLAAVLAAGALGGAIPLTRRGGVSGGRLLGWGNSLAAGIFLGTGLIHMLPDASTAWDSLGWRYPMAFLLAACGFVLMLLIETAHDMMHAPSNDQFTHPSGQSGLAAYAVLTALSVHSFLAGLTLGAEPELAGALVIFLAILAHKTTAGFALGVSLVRTAMARRHAWQLLAIFAFATPLGILLGLVLGGALDGPAQRTLEATFLALAAGTFAYVATLDILRNELLEPGGRLSRWVCVASGTGLTGMLALWV